MNLGVTPGVTTVRLTTPARLRARLAMAVVAAVVLAAQASAVTVSGALVADDAGATPKLYHVTMILAGALLLLRGRIPRPRNELLLYFAVTLAASLVAYFAFEPRVAVVKLLIALYVAIVAAGVGRVVDSTIVLAGCRLASVAFLALVTAKNAGHVAGFAAFLVAPTGHPDVPSLAGGGLNVEATWLALSSIFLIGTAWFVPFVLAAAATSALYASRAGVLVATVAVCAALARAWGSRRTTRDPPARRDAPAPHAAPAARDAAVTRSRAAGAWRRRTLALVLGVAAAGGVAAATMAAREYGDAMYVAQRFASIGEEPGSMGRLTLWRGGLRVFAEYPLGVGIGNAVPVLRRVLGVDVPEDNLHNVYLQHAVETGLPGLLVLLVFATTIVRRLAAVRFADHLLLFVAAYLVAGAIQFTGVDAMLWLAYGLQAGASGTASGATPGVAGGGSGG